MYMCIPIPCTEFLLVKQVYLQSMNARINKSITTFAQRLIEPSQSFDVVFPLTKLLSQVCLWMSTSWREGTLAIILLLWSFHICYL